MALPKKRHQRGNVNLLSAKWNVAFNVTVATFVDKYLDGLSEEDRKEVKIPLDNILALSAGIALKLVELEDGD
jgi:aminoglycoside phosphotransferase